MTQQLDPYYLVPSARLGVAAALQARAYLNVRVAQEDDMRAIATVPCGRPRQPVALHLDDLRPTRPST